jgi:hypothetical protein
MPVIPGKAFRNTRHGAKATERISPFQVSLAQ